MSKTSAQPTAIVTGASRGYGVGIARALRARGYTVFITGRSAEALEEVATELGATAIPADATRGADWDRVIETVLAATGRIDVLVNNAGAGGRIAPVAELSDDEVLDCLSLNLTATILGCRRVAPIMRVQRSGTIVNLSSVCAKYSWPGWSVYSAAKAGVERFSKGLYTELRDAGVRVTTLTPSWGATDFCEASQIAGHPALDPATRERCTHPDELGKLVADIVATPAHLEILELTVVPLVQELVPL